jgi:hypothetical protein
MLVASGYQPKQSGAYNLYFILFHTLVVYIKKKSKYIMEREEQILSGNERIGPYL